MKRVIFIVTAPSGAGKSTLIRFLRENTDCVDFSISATTREPREGEEDGVDYIFMSADDFQKAIDENQFIEHEEVYPGKYYGTLLSEIDRINADSKVPLLDLDVKGAWNIKQKFPDETRVVFIQPRSIEVLEERLRNRNTESERDIQERLDRAEYELQYADKFDYVIINDDLEQSQKQILQIFRDYADERGLCKDS